MRFGLIEKIAQLFWRVRRSASQGAGPFSNGVLKVTLPKNAPAQAKMRRVEINAPTKH
jgi:HSP20 family molecular chaperone IbpA